MLELYGLFKNGVVLQRNKEIRVFGVSSETDVVAHIIDGEDTLVSGTASTDEEGRFLICMDSLPEGGPYMLNVSSGSDTITLNDVYIGEVWLSCGEDNMLMPLLMTEAPTRSSSLAPSDGRFHFYRVPIADFADEELMNAEAETSWLIVDSRNAFEVSGVSYYFVLELMKMIDCHIGVIGCFALSSSVASWQSLHSLESSPEGRSYISDWESEVSYISDSVYMREKEDFDRDYKLWQRFYEKEAFKNPNAGYDILRKNAGDWPTDYPNGRLSYRRPGGLFDVMILRVFPFCFKGVIFYQGESDAEEYSNEYGVLLGTLIREWRTVLDDGRLPFLICQLPMFIDRDRNFMGYEDYKWPHLRDQQYKVSKTQKNVYLAVLSDCGEFDNIHPIDKKTPGTRLAYLALKKVYGYDDVSADAPYMVDLRKTNGGAEMSFEGDFSTLSINSTGKSGFEMSGEDGKFYPCMASVDFDGKTVMAYSSNVMDPVTVRYAYFSFGETSLSSDAGLAVLPFNKNIVKKLNDD